MTDLELAEYYANLLILQYLQKPNAYATIVAFCEMAIVNQIFLAIQNAFNLSDSIGVQLDVVGKYAGVTRSGFAFGMPVTLDDDDYRVLITLAIAQNSAGSSLSDIQSLLHRFFPGEIFVFDYQNMQMSYFINKSVGSQNLAGLFLYNNLLPRPMGVQLASIVYADDLTHFFGMRTYLLPAVNVSPFNSYTSYSMTSPWLSYADALII